MTPEGALLKAATTWLVANGYRDLAAKDAGGYLAGPGTFWRVPLGPIMRGGGAGRPPHPAPNPLRGFPDLQGTLHAAPGAMWTIELKSPDGYLRGEQRIWLARLSRAGIRCAVIRTIQGLARTMQRFEEGASRCKNCSGAAEAHYQHSTTGSLAMTGRDDR